MKLKGKGFILIYFALTLCVITNVDSRTTWSENLKTIQSTLGDDISKSKIEKIRDFLASDDGSELGKAIPKTVEAIGQGVKKVITKDPLQIAQGTFGIVSGFASLVPSAAPIVSTVFSLVSTILSCVGGIGQVSAGEIAQKRIDMAFEKYADATLKEKFKGAAEQFRISQAYITNHEGHELKPHEIAALSGNVPIYQNAVFMGILQNKINVLNKKIYKDDIDRAMEYLNLYATLATLRSAIVWQLYSLIRSDQNSKFTAAGCKRVAESNEKTEKSFLKFLVNPEYKHAAFLGKFNPSEWPVITALVKARGLKFQDLSSHFKGLYPQVLIPERWPHFLLSMDYRDERTMRVIHQHYKGPAEEFYIIPISKVDNTFYIRSVAFSNRYVAIKSDGDCYGTSRTFIDGEKWKIVKYGSYFLLSTLRIPNCHVRNAEKKTFWGTKYERVECKTGDPGPEGHWIIKDSQ